MERVASGLLSAIKAGTIPSPPSRPTWSCSLGAWWDRASSCPRGPGQRGHWSSPQIPPTGLPFQLPSLPKKACPTRDLGCPWRPDREGLGPPHWQGECSPSWVVTGRQLEGLGSILGYTGRGARIKRGWGEVESGGPGLLVSHTLIGKVKSTSSIPGPHERRERSLRNIPNH